MDSNLFIPGMQVGMTMEDNQAEYKRQISEDKDSPNPGDERAIIYFKSPLSQTVTHYAKISVRRDNDGQCGLNINLPSGNISGNQKRLLCIILALLFISGIEQNPGPPTKKQTTLPAPVHSGERENQ
ncbi:hypothetical protein LAZ67_14002414 [Cordylochernes scorpioides]|uniref:Uncharacterized protein n=1 Tax=Cordylochernes scorpioides TaxID=51811 RepID=A0ABY6L6Z6_9ARAC|nr:hypothetical protein LAZ67_14002414 [Cordylochernes scorpioides]